MGRFRRSIERMTIYFFGERFFRIWKEKKLSHEKIESISFRWFIERIERMTIYFSGERFFRIWKEKKMISHEKIVSISTIHRKNRFTFLANDFSEFEKKKKLSREKIFDFDDPSKESTRWRFSFLANDFSESEKKKNNLVKKLGRFRRSIERMTIYFSGERFFRIWKEKNIISWKNWVNFDDPSKESTRWRLVF